MVEEILSLLYVSNIIGNNHKPTHFIFKNKKRSISILNIPPYQQSKQHYIALAVVLLLFLVLSFLNIGVIT